MLAAVRVRSDIDAREKVSRTLQDLNLDKNNQCAVFEGSDSVRGMLELVKDYVAYGEIEDETLEALKDRRGGDIENGDTVNLTAPSGGYRDTKKNVGQGGSLGQNPDMDQLIQSMV